MARAKPVRRRPTAAQQAAEAAAAASEPVEPVETPEEIAAREEAELQEQIEAEEADNATITDPAVAVVTDAPTTVDPDGNEAVTTIDGDPIQPNSDGSDGATLGANLSAPPTTGAPETVPGSAAASAEGVAAASAVDPKKLSDEDIEGSEFRQYYSRILEEADVTPPTGRILFPGEPLTFSGSIRKKDHIILTEDVYRMVLPFRSKRPTFTLEARAGKRINNVRVVTKDEYLSAVGDLYDGLV
jgi:hypothetical protein